MHITVVGAGYVGLVAGTCFAETGHDVSIIDVDKHKVSTLQEGEIPFYEPGLKDLLIRNIRQKRLVFGTDIRQAIAGAQVAFIAVGTPQAESGSADLRNVLEVAGAIGDAMTGALVVVNKSTVPVGTARKVEQIIRQRTSHPVRVVSNPEFLKEGAAVEDFMRPDRVVIGTDDEEARHVMTDIYAPFMRTNNPILFMDCLSAEMTKYASNCLLAARITFMNEIANLCDAVGADVDLVRVAVGSDKRIGHSFLFPGVGYGGSCFPKDVRALDRTAEAHGVHLSLIKATDESNESQKRILPRRIFQEFGPDLSGMTFALWGLAFKPRTDDMREAPSLVIIDELLRAGAAIRAFDPEAMGNARRILGNRITFCESNYQTCEGADALIIATEWNEFRRPDFDRLKRLLRRPAIFDGRNIFDPNRMHELGFDYVCIGRNRNRFSRPDGQ